MTISTGAVVRSESPKAMHAKACLVFPNIVIVVGVFDGQSGWMYRRLDCQSFSIERDAMSGRGPWRTRALADCV